MGFRTVLVYHSPSGRPAPAVTREFASANELLLNEITDAEEVLALVNRTFPAGIVMETDGSDGCFRLCKVLKSDAFSAIVPVLMTVPTDRKDLVLGGLEAGADEVLAEDTLERERILRMHMILNRADRDVSVHPTTRLPGTPQIERDITERIRREEFFAVCYADLDHFKEFNDRYGYNEGDGVIKLLSRILRDLVKGHSPEGFIGHIGGDDFIFNVPLDKMRVICEEIIEIFDELIPFQYTEEDRRAGYFLGRDRRGNILWVPLMTLSIGVVTNEQRSFEHTARVSELATEMKSFAKKLPGSVYAVDRRSDAKGTYFGQSIVSSEELEAPRES
ncbi:MAG TPA: diguanylate cyclase [Longimicrobiales bacterium]|nr:diguanylate cyclase [Longimicrobiales bacterium]